MQRVFTKNLSGHALNYAVIYAIMLRNNVQSQKYLAYYVDSVQRNPLKVKGDNFCSDYNLGMKLLVKEGYDFKAPREAGGDWFVSDPITCKAQHGRNLLEAGMRCFVDVYIGADVLIPEALMSAPHEFKEEKL